MGKTNRLLAQELETDEMDNTRFLDAEIDHQVTRSEGGAMTFDETTPLARDRRTEQGGDSAAETGDTANDFESYNVGQAVHRHQQLVDLPTLQAFLDDLDRREDPRNRQEVSAYDLELEPQGLLAVKTQAPPAKYPVSPAAMADLARVVEIPFGYFEDCEPDLQSISFERRLVQKVPAGRRLTLIFDEAGVSRVLNRKLHLLPAPRGPILDTVANAIPESVRKEELRIVVYLWSDSFDVSLLAPGFQCEPKPGDTVAFGVNISEGRDGAVQVQGAAYRLICSNGAIIRVCSGSQHRIRRPSNRPGREAEFLGRIRSFASEAWDQCSSNGGRLTRLTEERLGRDYEGPLRSRLRQAPFFLSATIVNLILARLHIEAGEGSVEPDAYDLWNAMTFLGTHDQTLSRTYRTRLRLGAGEFTRHASQVCSTCKQLRLS